MFLNTHSGYHSMSARPEEAVSYRCQSPRWPSPSPQHSTQTHGTGGLEDCPPLGQRNGGFLWRTGNQTFLTQWREWSAGSISTHFKVSSIDPTELQHKAPMGCWVMPMCSWWPYVLTEFQLLSALLPLRNTWRTLGGKDWWVPVFSKTLFWKH